MSVRAFVIAGVALVAAGGRISAQREVGAVALRTAPTEASTRYARLRPMVQPSLAAWITSQARVEARRDEPDLAALESAIGARIPVMPALGGQDVEEVAFLVLMEATTDQDQDLQTIMSEVQAQTAAKQQVRNLLNQVQQMSGQLAGRGPAAVCQSTVCQSLAQQLAGLAATAARGGQRLVFTVPQSVTANTLQSLQNQLTNAGDGMNEMSQQTQLALQIAMDRRSKFYDMLSNVMGKISKTDDAVVANMK